MVLRATQPPKPSFYWKENFVTTLFHEMVLSIDLQDCVIWCLDYFLWECVKSIAYADKETTLEASEVNTNRAINEMRPEILEKVAKN